MLDFTFHNPTTVLFGKDTIAKIGPRLAADGHRRVMMIAGGGSIKDNGVYGAVTESLGQAGISLVEFWGVTPNPTLERVRDAIDDALADEVDAILAVGGGSVIDSAKAVAAGVYLDDVWTAFETPKPIEQALPLYVVLTLSATGSEMNGTAVITNEEEKKKWPIWGPALYPRAAVIDPSVQRHLPARQTVNGAVDTLSHLMEFYFMGSTQETTIAVDEALMRTVIASMDVLSADPLNYTARSNMAWSSTMALNGISGIGMRGGDWCTHMLEHGISALFTTVAHAEGLAVMFPAWIRASHEQNPDQFLRWARNVWHADSVEQGVKAMQERYESWGAPITLGDIGIKAKDIPALVENVMQRGEPGNLWKLSARDVEAVFRLAL